MYKTLIVSNMDKARSPSFISKAEGCIQAWSACKNANGIIMIRSSSLDLKGIPASQQLIYVNKQLIIPEAEDQGPLPFSYVLPPEEYELGLCGIDKGWASLIAGWQKIGYKVRVFSDASIVKPETREMLGALRLAQELVPAKQKRTFCSYKTIYK